MSPARLFSRPRRRLRGAVLIGGSLLGLSAPVAATAKPVTTVVDADTNPGGLTSVGDTYAYLDGADLIIGRGTKLKTADLGGRTARSPLLGTDEAGRKVVVFANCPRKSQTSCDLLAYDVQRGSTTRVQGVNGARTGETYGFMVRGAVLYGRTVGKTAQLRYRPAGASTSRVLPGAGGALAFNGRWFAQEQPIEGDDGLCDGSQIDLVSLGGKRKLGKRQGCGLDEQRIFSAGFAGSKLIIGVESLSGTTVFRQDQRGGRNDRATFKNTPLGVAVLSDDSVVFFTTKSPFDLAEGETAPPPQLVRVTGVDWRGYP